MVPVVAAFVVVVVVVVVAVVMAVAGWSCGCVALQAGAVVVDLILVMLCCVVVSGEEVVVALMDVYFMVAKLMWLLSLHWQWWLLLLWLLRWSRVLWLLCLLWWTEQSEFRPRGCHGELAPSRTPTTLQTNHVS